MSDFVYNRNQISIGPGIDLSTEMYMDNWRASREFFPFMRVVFDIKGQRRNAMFDEVLNGYHDANMLSYFDPERHKVANMSGNKKRHIISIIMIKSDEDRTRLNEMAVLAGQYNTNERISWEDPRYKAHRFFCNIPDPFRAFTFRLDDNVNMNPLLRLSGVYFEMAMRFYELGFYLSENLN